MDYSPEAKAARMNAVLLMLQGGCLELCTAEDVCIASVPLSGGTMQGATIVFPAAEQGCYATAKGRVKSAELCAPSGVDVITGLSVGKVGSKADVIIDYIDLDKGQIVSIASIAIEHA